MLIKTNFNFEKIYKSSLNHIKTRIKTSHYNAFFANKNVLVQQVVIEVILGSRRRRYALLSIFNFIILIANIIS